MKRVVLNTFFAAVIGLGAMQERCWGIRTPP